MSNQPSYINYHQDYTTVRKSMFLGGKIGLIENLRNEFPEIWKHYKKLKALDWEETEIDISSCREEFKNGDPKVNDLMIKTLAWQFEADSSAAHVGALMLPMTSSSELQCFLIEHMKNESLHSLAYKFIVESSFDNPEEFLKVLLSIEESFKRLESVKKVFDEVYLLSHKYAVGLETDTNKLRKAIFKFWAAVYALERIQFMGSFSITFGLAEGLDGISRFVPIAKLVQKICTDEYQVHVQAAKDILRNEMNIEEYFGLYMEIRDEIAEVIREVTQSELTWLDFLFGEDEARAGIRKKKIANFILYSATDVYRFFNMDNPFGDVEENPLPWLNNWIVIDNNQSAPQEESTGNYLLGAYVDDLNTVDMNKYGLKF